MAIIIPFCVQGGEPDPFVRKPFLQGVETHEFKQVVSRLELQLLNVDGWLVLVRGTQQSSHA